MTLRCPPEPCPSCPYRRDTPPGVWDASEYEKLRKYDRTFEDGPVDVAPLGIFLCHQSTAAKEDAACRGWLAVHADSIAVRIAVLRGVIRPGEPFKPVKAPLYASGNEAADAGMRELAQPGRAARTMIAKLVARPRRRRHA